MQDEPKGRNILKLILIVRFACATLDMGHPIYTQTANISALCSGCAMWWEICEAKGRQRFSNLRLGDNRDSDKASGEPEFAEAQTFRDQYWLAYRILRENYIPTVPYSFIAKIPGIDKCMVKYPHKRGETVESLA
jgi:hypothetical protein